MMQNYIYGVFTRIMLVLGRLVVAQYSDFYDTFDCFKIQLPSTLLSWEVLLCDTDVILLSSSSVAIETNSKSLFFDILALQF